MTNPLPKDFVFLVRNDSKFLLDLLTLLYPNLHWAIGVKRPNEQYENCSENTIALYVQDKCLTYLEKGDLQENYHPTLPRFTGPEFLRKFVFGEGVDQEFLTRNNLVQLGPLTKEEWSPELLVPRGIGPYWTKKPRIPNSEWDSHYSGSSPQTLLYALPYGHPLLLDHVARVLDLQNLLKPEIIPPKKPVLDDLFTI